MPLDIPREDDFDDSFGDIPAYQIMNIVNDVDNDSDFSFSSDEDDDNGGNLENVHAPNVDDDSDRYANYELIGQGNDIAEAGDLNESSLEDDAEGNGARDRFFQHNVVVQWIETEEPLFDREQFEALQQERRQRQLHQNSINQTTDSSGETNANPSGHVEISHQLMDHTTESGDILNVSSPSSASFNEQQNSNIVQKESELDNEKIDTIKGLMSNFKLPDDSYPGWAKEISDDEWRTSLDKCLEKFHHKS